MNNADRPAHPIIEKVEEVPNGEQWFHCYEGLTKREAFAMAAMQGMLSNDSLFLTEGKETRYNIDPNSISEASVFHADALLKALEE